MSRAAISSLVWGIYLIVVSLVFFTIPDVALKLIGLDAHKDVWIYVAALLVLNLAVYFIVAARSESTMAFRASVVMRYIAAVIFVAFAVLQLTKFNIVIFGVGDALGATWTGLALLADSRAQKPALAAS
jgi:hypothetical protein